ncbi:MAG: protein-tyrosine phosphatase family protein [Pseudomonadota bacterium]
MQGINIYEVPVDDGMIGISPIPGGNGAYEDDLLAIHGWGAKAVLTMTTMHELEAVGAGQIADHMAAMKIDWHHLPISDFGAPSAEVQRLWTDAADAAHTVLDAGGRVLTHCRAGCGRSGMAALRLLVERGERPRAALERLREVRPCAVETDRQFLWAASWVAD